MRRSKSQLQYKIIKHQSEEAYSGIDTPTLESSTDSPGSWGMYANQYSDSTGSGLSSSVTMAPSPTRASSDKECDCLLKKDSIRNFGTRIPLFDVTCEKKFKEYSTILGIDDEKPFSNSPLSSQSSDSTASNKDHKTNSIVTIFAVWNTIMGSSLLTMAWGVERAGLIPGIMLVMIMGGLCLFTSYTLLQVCYHHGGGSNCEVPDLCRMLLGPWAEIIAKIFSLIVMMGATIVYWVLMTNFLYHSVNYFKDFNTNNTTTIGENGGVLCPKGLTMNITGNNTEIMPSWGGKYWDLYSTVPLYVAALIFPLLNFKSPSFFTKFNSLGTLSVLYLMIFVIVKGANWGLHIDSWLSEIIIRADFTVLSGMLALSFYIHNIIITIMRNNKHQENNGRDLSIAFILVTGTYILVGAIFYMCFPLAKMCIEDNILNNFVKSDAMTAIARVLLLFQVITVYPMIAYMLRIEVLGSKEEGSRMWKVITFNIAVVAVCILFACFVPKIGTIIRYTGALSGLIHVFTLPSLLQMTSLHMRGKLTILKVIFYVLIFFIGAFNLLSQFFVTD